ncbi:MAG: hypothetical protein A2W91_05885 [Bacteroidetes bacterium GWF2_38_335]|nr:MAG: hypothetical protein A2W91_05885 [Bacteroidetes bacterium GWF2_38_335]OFY81641.1 MAG: hypothetical protein A2281_11680 [Bacteroidetes bacterium RIFOXYA12_FULL_38_20]
MNQNTIGINAGKIWRRLDEGELTNPEVNVIREECGLSSEDFLLALGWLSRENKIRFMIGKKKIYVFPAD